MNDVTLNVTQAVSMINQSLAETLPFMIVEGEVASFKVNQNKFVFFDIKDEGSTLNCFMMVFKLNFPLQDGMKVRIIAQPKVTQWGRFSLTVDQVMPIGEGSLKKSFELLKAKLDAEGLFDELRKRDLPTYPNRIGIVSSAGAAGYADFIKILGNRWGGLELVLVDVPVQGIEAPQQLIGALRYLNELAEPVEVIALLRGGGSADDLSAFNHEGLVREIVASRTPTITGVGHEVDVSLADLAADRRAATPSNAAEILIPDKREVLNRAERTCEMAHNGAVAAIKVFIEDTAVARQSIDAAVGLLLDSTQERLEFFNRTLQQLNPETVLRRGYALVKNESGLLQKASDAILGSDITIQLHDGEIGANITNVHIKN